MSTECFHVMIFQLITGSMALNRCVIKRAPFCTPTSPCDKFAMECPRATVTPIFVRAFITIPSASFSGASVIIFTLLKLL